MSTLEEQKASNKGVGWGKVIVGRFKEDVEQLKTKFKKAVFVMAFFLSTSWWMKT